MRQQILTAVVLLTTLNFTTLPTLAKPQPTASSKVDNSGLILENYQAFRNGSTICVRGQIKNTSGKQLKYVLAVADYYAASGEYIDSQMGDASPEIMLNNQKGQFSVLDAFTNPAIEIARIRFVSSADTKKDISYAAPGAKTPLVVRVRQASGRFGGC